MTAHRSGEFVYEKEGVDRVETNWTHRRRKDILKRVELDRKERGAFMRLRIIEWAVLTILALLLLNFFMQN